MREILVGDLPWEDFREMARHSLAPWANSGLTYEHVDEIKLADVNFGRHPGWKTIYELVESCDLLIVDIGRKFAPNSYHGPCVSMAVGRARDLGKPAWVYIENTSKIHTEHGGDVYKMLQPVQKTLEMA